MLACLMAALLVGTVDLGSAMEAPLGPEPGLSQ